MKRLSSFNLIVLGLLAMVVGSFGFHMANEMGGRAFDTGPQGARDSGLYFFFMMAAGVVALGGAYAFILGCLRIRRPKGPRPRDAEVFD